jgi:hypothetical protein
MGYCSMCKLSKIWAHQILLPSQNEMCQMCRQPPGKPLPPKWKIEWYPMCPLWWESSCELQGMYGVQGPTKEHILKPVWIYRIHLWGTASTSNIEILECLQMKAFGCTLVCAKYDYPKGSPHTNTYRGIPPLRLSIQCSPQHTPKWPNSKPHGATRQQAIEMTPSKWSAYQIPSVIVAFVILVFKV